MFIVEIIWGIIWACGVFIVGVAVVSLVLGVVILGLTKFWEMLTD